jgi:hypothetical protein
MSYAHEFFPIQGNKVLAEIADERARQDAKWGEQNHPDGTGHKKFAVMRDAARAACERAAASRHCTTYGELFGDLLWQLDRGQYGPLAGRLRELQGEFTGIPLPPSKENER